VNNAWNDVKEAMNGTEAEPCRAPRMAGAGQGSPQQLAEKLAEQGREASRAGKGS
jgi:hypothetical protein